jgi:hypothetical protein
VEIKTLPDYLFSFWKIPFHSPNTGVLKLLMAATIDSSGPFMGQFGHAVRRLIINLPLPT